MRLPIKSSVALLSLSITLVGSGCGLDQQGRSAALMHSRSVARARCIEVPYGDANAALVIMRQRAGCEAGVEIAFAVAQQANRGLSPAVEDSLRAELQRRGRHGVDAILKARDVLVALSFRQCSERFVNSVDRTTNLDGCRAGVLYFERSVFGDVPVLTEQGAAR